MTDINFGQQPTVNWVALDAELRAALPNRLNGTTYARGYLFVHVKDGEDAEALRPQIAAVILAHNPAVLSAEQQVEQRRAAVRDALRVADFAAARDTIQTASSLAALKPVLFMLLRLIYRVALAQGLTDAEDPEA